MSQTYYSSFVPDVGAIGSKGSMQSAGAGTDGLNNATIFVFKRSATIPSPPSVTATYTFATATLSGLNNGWSTTPPATDGNPLYVIAVTASSAGPSDTIGSAEWSSPVIQAQDGGTGTNGLNTASVYLFKRNNTGIAPAAPTATLTYTFATAQLSGGVLDGWTPSVPASSGGSFLFVITATALSSGPTDTISNAEWAAAQILAQDGASGLNNASVFAFRRSASVPGAPSVVATYTFSTGVLTGLNNGWSPTVPTSDGNPLYVIAATASSTGVSDTIAGAEWSSAVIQAQDGAGGTGTNGLNTASIYLYQRNNTGTPPSVPVDTLTYTFSTTVLSGGSLNGWTRSVPVAAGGKYLFVTTATALSSSSTDTLTSGEWAAVQILAQDGIDGTIGLNNATVFIFKRASSVPAVPSVNATYTFASTSLTGLNNGWSTTVPSTDGSPLYVSTATASSAGITDIIVPGDWSAPTIQAKDGVDGQGGGTSAISAYLTRESIQLSSFANGGVTNYNAATGDFKVFSGTTDISASFTLSTISNPQTLTVTYTGQTYSITAGFDDNEDIASITIRATGSGTYAGVILDKIFNLTKAKGGFEIVGTLPTTTLFAGRIVFLITDSKLYRYTGSVWTSAVPALDITGTLADAQIAAIAAGKVTGQLTNAQLADLAATKITGQLTNAQLASIDAAKVAGQLTNAQLASIDAAKVAGQLTNVQLLSIDAAKVAGQIVETQIASDAITTPKIFAGAITTAKIAADAVTANEIAALTITAGEIAANTITGAKILAGSVNADRLVADSVTATQIAALTITADEIAANTITGTKILAGSVNADRLVADSVTAAQIAANTITSAEILAGSVNADRLVAGSVTAGQIAALTITAAEIAGGTITGAKILAGSVNADRLVADSVTATQIASLAITANEIAALTITGDKIVGGTIQAAKLNVTELSAITNTVGLLRTASIGARTEIESNQIRVYDSAGTMRVRIGVW